MFQAWTLSLAMAASITAATFQPTTSPQPVAFAPSSAGVLRLDFEQHGFFPVPTLIQWEEALDAVDPEEGFTVIGSGSYVVPPAVNVAVPGGATRICVTKGGGFSPVLVCARAGSRSRYLLLFGPVPTPIGMPLPPAAAAVRISGIGAGNYTFKNAAG